jgi:osmotically-inducible protein OsmY
MSKHLRLFLALTLALATGCAGSTSKEAATLARQDSAEAVRIKAALFEAPGLAGSAIDVTLQDNEVILEGLSKPPHSEFRPEPLPGNTALQALW